MAAFNTVWKSKGINIKTTLRVLQCKCVCVWRVS